MRDSIVKDDPTLSARLDKCIGYSYCFIADYQNALKYSLRSLESYSEQGDNVNIGSCYNNLGIIYYYAGALDLALHYFNISLTICEESSYDYGIGQSLLGIGCIYGEVHQIDQANEYLEKSLKIALDIKDIRLQVRAIQSLGEVQFYVKNYDQCIVHCEECNDLLDQKSHFDDYWVYITEGRCFIELKQYDKAANCINRAISTSQDLKNELHELTAKFYSAQIDFYQGLKDEALKSLDKLLGLADSKEYYELEQEILDFIIELNDDPDKLSELNQRLVAVQKGIIAAAEDTIGEVIRLSESVDAFETAEIIRTKELEEQHGLIRKLNEIGRAIISCLSTEEIIEKAYERINEVMPLNAFGYGLINKDKTAIIKVVREDGVNTEITDDLSEDVYSVKCFKTGEPVIVNQEVWDDEEHEKAQASRKTGRIMSSILYYPLRTSGECFGVITVQSDQYAAYSEAHFGILEVLASYSAIALENVSAFEKLETLSEIGKEVTSTFDVEVIANKLYSSILEMMPSSVFIIARFDEPTGKIDYVKVIEDGDLIDDTFGVFAQHKESLGAYSVLNKAEVFINERTEIANFISKSNPTYGKLSESIIYIPLLNQEEAIGFLSVQNFEKHSYTKQHLEILRNMASYLSVPLINSNSHNLFKTIGEIGKEITAAHTIREVNSIIHRLFGNIIPVESCSIGLFDKKEGTLEYPNPIEEGYKVDNKSISLDEDTLASKVFNGSEEIVIRTKEDAKQHVKFPDKYKMDGGDKASESMIYIPLFQDDQTLGVLSVETSEKNAYSEQDLILVKNLASYVMVAVQNTRSLDNLSQLSLVGQEVMMQTSIEDITDLLHQRLDSFLDASIFYIGLYHKLDDSIRLVRVYEQGKISFEDYVLTGTTSSSIALYCARTDHSYIGNKFDDLIKYIPNYTHDESRGEHPESIIAIPMIYQGEVNGVISVQTYKKNAYNKEQFEIMKNIASFVSTTIHNISTQKTLSTLGELGSKITSTLELNESFKTIHDGLDTLLDATFFSISVYDKEENKVHQRYAVEDEKQIEDDVVFDGESKSFPGNWAIKNKKTIHINDLEKEYQTYSDNLKGNFGKFANSVVYKPLIYQNKVVGLLSVQSKKKDAYGAFEMHVMDSVASYATSAIQNGISYEALEQTKKEIEKLSIVASKTDNAIVIANETGEIEWINDAYEQISGKNLEEMIEEDSATIQGASSHDEIEKIIKEVISTKHSVNYEAVVSDSDQNKKFVQTTLTPIIDSEGKVHKLIAIDSDITFQKLAELEIREINKDLTDSINYAKRIQTSMLPAEAFVQKALPGSFVYFEPKDIVSGDFYWMTRTENEELVIAAVDCTGHGVPGAFLTIVGTNLLNQIVIQEGISSPGKILEELNVRFLNRFPSSADKKVQDGMDASICTLVKGDKDMDVAFAGAFNSIYYYLEGEICEVAANRYAIGTPFENKPLTFDEQSLMLESGTMVYLFSDGYPDQLGGTKGKKFMKPRFRELLAEISTKKPAEQKKILKETFLEWSGDNPQVDDVLIMGIKI